MDQSISFWDMSTGKLKARIHEGVGWVKTLAFSPDGRRIAFGGRDCTVQLRELEELGLRGRVGPILSLAPGKIPPRNRGADRK